MRTRAASVRALRPFALLLVRDRLPVAVHSRAPACRVQCVRFMMTSPFSSSFSPMLGRMQRILGGVCRSAASSLSRRSAVASAATSFAPRRAMSSAKEEYAWNDPLNLESRLTDEEIMIRDAARSFAQQRLLPIVTECSRKEEFDPKLMREFGEVGTARHAHPL